MDIKEDQIKMGGVQPLDYSKVENWVINANANTNTDFDLIFFCGTSVFNPSSDNGVGDVSEEMRALGFKNFINTGSQLTENARIFCPLQRQLALSYALQYETHGNLIKDIATKEPYVDLSAALDYYFEHYNRNAERPFVLAGHSQGAAALQVALWLYFISTEKKEYLKNMIAAYSMGYGVSKKYFEKVIAGIDYLHFAEGEDDFNCLISWNTEGVGDKGPSFLLAEEDDETLVINPLNWKRDETYASINENAGVLVSETTPDGKTRYHISLLPEDLCDAQIDAKRGSVICSTKKDYIQLPGSTADLWGGKSLHNYDGKGYYNNIKQNIRLRVKNFLKAKEASK